MILLALPVAAADTVIQNATVLTITKGTFHGSILIRDGKITETGEKVMVPPGATVVDASGQYVMPGIIDCHSHIAADSINEGSVAVSSMVGIEDVLNPESMAIYRALAGGVTTANILHGSANPIGGKCAVIKLRWGKDAKGIQFEGATPGIKFALGENVTRPGRPSGSFGVSSPASLRYPGTRMGTEDVIREAFTEARAYQKEWRAYQAKVERHESAIPPVEGETQLPRAALDTYSRVFKLLGDSGYSDLVRVWNYVPDMSFETAAGNRYRLYQHRPPLGVSCAQGYDRCGGANG